MLDEDMDDDTPGQLMFTRSGVDAATCSLVALAHAVDPATPSANQEF